MASPGSPKTERRRVRVRGIVQGVGFRPFVYRLAEEEHLAGWVLNDPLGVLAEVEGAPDALDRFERRLKDDAPPLARVMGVESERVVATGPSEGLGVKERGFVIRESVQADARTTLVSPDVATCADCLRELFDPHDRRFRYPFINCTNCGPRFTIIRAIPYDRPKTTMSVFPMCDACRREYGDPRDRRFHAQPDACAECGPRAWLADPAGREMNSADAFNRAAHFLHEGQVVAVKGLGGFHLACDATSERAVARLRRRKGREEKPFAVMARSVDAVRRFAEVRPDDARLLESPERPIVLLLKKSPSGPLGKGASGFLEIAPSVAPRSKYVGVMLPYTPLHHLLLAEGLDVLVMTSGNVSDEPLASANDEALARLKGIADYFLLHDRAIHVSCDDSVVRSDAGGLRMMRRARGYVPAPIPLDDGPVILAVGAELKSAVALTRGGFAFLSRHVGDVKNAETHDYFVRTIDHMKAILAVEPEIVAHDLHPDYHSTRYALNLKGVRRVAVQHHHAHIASCMAEHALDEKVLGIALDGTGYGADGHTWGGEFLAADRAGYERLAHFEYLPLPGGDRAVVEPWRTAVSALVRAFGDDWRTLDLDLLRRHDKLDLKALAQMIAKGLNCPLSSGAGRVFDAVSALIGVCELETYEGQPAIELEAVAAEGVTDEYPFDVAHPPSGEAASSAQPRAATLHHPQPGAATLHMQSHPGAGVPHEPQAGEWVVGFSPAYRAIVDDLRAGVSAPVISARFHNTVVAAVAETARRLKLKTGLARVCLSGGVFQNRYLCDRLVPKLRAAGFDVFEQSIVPPNDGGIALGQAAVARCRCR